MLGLMAVVWVSSIPADGHDVVTTKLTWSKEVSRVIYRRCAGCHVEGGKAFSLVQYEEARPWAKAIQETVLRRQMPPWNAVKGFGDFRNDAGLSQEEIHTIADWVEGGSPEGDPALLPPLLRAPKPSPLPKGPRITLRGSLRIRVPLRLAAIEIGQVAEGTSFKFVAETPAGERIPLLWIDSFSAKAPRDYVLRTPLPLPAGTRLIAYPAAGVTLSLIGS